MIQALLSTTKKQYIPAMNFYTCTERTYQYFQIIGTHSTGRNKSKRKMQTSEKTMKKFENKMK